MLDILLGLDVSRFEPFGSSILRNIHTKFFFWWFKAIIIEPNHDLTSAVTVSCSTE